MCVSATPTPTPTSTNTPTPTPTFTPTPTPTPIVPSICVPVSYTNPYDNYIVRGAFTNPVFPLGSEYASATPVYDANFGWYYQLDCTQEKYSFDYYAIYSPLTVMSSGAQKYNTLYGFIASYDPKTKIYYHGTGSLNCDAKLIKAVYR